MCKWGTDTSIAVPVRDEDGKLYYEYRKIDTCLVPIIQALLAEELWTEACCCGHGKGDGLITLHNGARIVLQNWPIDLDKDREEVSWKPLSVFHHQEGKS